ncbi:MAG TPA: hypothetical protein VKC17_03500 [Sphingomicrobium sp.]|nr:hypothetical protein [Sphingomicrobium sp.]
MNYRLPLSVALAMLAASPVLAQGNTAAPANTSEATPPDATVGNATHNAATAATPADNAAVAAPADTAAAAEPAAPAPQPEPKSFPWGVLGLLGLIGLIGGRKSAS